MEHLEPFKEPCIRKFHKMCYVFELFGLQPNRNRIILCYNGDQEECSQAAQISNKISTLMSRWNTSILCMYSTASRTCEKILNAYISVRNRSPPGDEVLV